MVFKQHRHPIERGAAVVFAHAQRTGAYGLDGENHLGKADVGKPSYPL